MMNGIELKDITVNLGDFSLNEVNLAVPKGTIMGLVGRNGAGKTTLIKTIARCYKLEKGHVSINGIQKSDDEVAYINQLGIVYDQLSINRYLRPKQIIKILEKNFPKFDKDFFLRHLDTFNIPINRQFIHNSLGTNKKFSILIALSLKPKVLMLDEPTSGIDLSDKKEIIRLLQTFMEDEDNTILYSTHIISDLERIADYIALIDDGEIKWVNNKDDIIKALWLVSIKKSQLNQEIKEAMIYLKKETNGFEGLTTNKAIIDQHQLHAIKPSIEQILERYMELYKKKEVAE
ncbi:MAG: ABC transporter ATP-binding protein [Acholeplasma sp.]|nr:ABC transporter ATP-binding protein [Acholeplasma sp.]